MPDLDAAIATINVRCALLPVGCDMEVPDFAATHYFEAILDGALGRMYSYPKSPWGDTKLAQYHLRRFRNEMAKARDVAKRRFTRADPEWATPASGWNSGFSGVFGSNG